jgi:hypothetical protein
LSLEERLEALGRTLSAREAGHANDLDRARRCADDLHDRVVSALERFHAAAKKNAPHLGIVISPPRPDDKHLRSVEFDLTRGRYRAIVTVKSRGEITLVGPFRSGKTEGPCRTFPIDSGDEVEEALGDFLVEFIEEAATP